MDTQEIYTYESRCNIYDNAKQQILECKAFNINGKECESLIDVMNEDVSYLFSLLEDVKEVIIEDESGKRKDVKVGNTPLNNQLANTISIVNKRILEAEKLKRELGEKMRKLLTINKQNQAELDEQITINGYVTDEMLEEHGKVFNEMSMLLNGFVDSDAIAIEIVKYRNDWTEKYGLYLQKYHPEK